MTIRRLVKIKSYLITCIFNYRLIIASFTVAYRCVNCSLTKNRKHIIDTHFPFLP